MDAVTAGLVSGWASIGGGVVSGVWMGMSFHRRSWLGGYTALRRRLVRLAHIACFGIGMLNLLFALTVGALGLESPVLRVATLCFPVAAVAMPVACLCAAWRPRYRPLFAIPVTALIAAIAAMLIAWSTR
jgi:hypothetical protein